MSFQKFPKLRPSYSQEEYAKDKKSEPSFVVARLHKKNLDQRIVTKKDPIDLLSTTPHKPCLKPVMPTNPPRHTPKPDHNVYTPWKMTDFEPRTEIIVNPDEDEDDE